MLTLSVYRGKVLGKQCLGKQSGHRKCCEKKSPGCFWIKSRNRSRFAAIVASLKRINNCIAGALALMQVSQGKQCLGKQSGHQKFVKRNLRGLWGSMEKQWQVRSYRSKLQRIKTALRGLLHEMQSMCFALTSRFVRQVTFINRRWFHVL